MPDLRLYAHDRLPTRMPADADEYVLTPGSVLYVPRSFWHETESDEESISLHVHHIPVPWVDAVLVTLRAKLLRDPAWRAGAHDLWDASRRSHTAATADRLLDALATAVDGLTADDVLLFPLPYTRVSLNYTSKQRPRGYTRVPQDTAQPYDCQRPPQSTSARLSAR